jgi:hypothetical protein
LFGLKAIASPAATAALAAAAATTSAVAATAAAATESTPAPTAAKPAATSTAAPTGTLFARARFVYGQGATIMLLAVQRRHGRGCLFVAGHLDESESLAPAGVPVIDDLGGDDLAMRRK